MGRPVVAEDPTGPVPVPDAVRGLAGGSRITPVWRNELGGLTFRLDGGHDGTRYVKWVAAGTPEIDLPGEAERLDWAQQWVPSRPSSNTAWTATAPGWSPRRCPAARPWTRGGSPTR
ncbi:hypothetical protein [Pseudonocardia nigra]|uniref:hypothetical protein n=1 Tax=Pseudonocardia nigra TaxID=1921578 RepID=UPI0027E266A8|nr:hypothetical protein [Pseudonocardia nigra]